MGGSVCIVLFDGLSQRIQHRSNCSQCNLRKCLIKSFYSASIKPEAPRDAIVLIFRFITTSFRNLDNYKVLLALPAAVILG